MRPYKQLLDILTNLYNLETVKNKLQNMIVAIELIKTKGDSWIEEKETSTYQEIKQFITDQTSEVLQCCFTMTEQFHNGNKTICFKVSHPDPDCDESQIKRLNENLDKLQCEVTVKDKQIDKLLKLLTAQSTVSNDIHTLDGNVLEFRADIMKELHDDRSLTALLHTKCDAISKDVNDYKKQEAMKDRMLEYVSSKTDTIVKQQDDLKAKVETILQNQEDFSFQMDKFKHKCDCIAEGVDTRNVPKNPLSAVNKNQSRNTQQVKKSTRLQEPSEFVCKVTGLSDVQCVRHCPHIIGHHEQQVSGNIEADLYKHFTSCTKNPGHKDFIPVDTFKMIHLPKGHRNKDLFELIKAVVELTVRVNVTRTSPHRPMFWPNTTVPYFCRHLRGSKHLRGGSGMINEVIKSTEGACPCDTCQQSGNPSTDWWKIRVGTAANLVFGATEANSATLTLFYDNKESSEVNVKVVTTDFYKYINRDVSWFYCVTCDQKLAADLSKGVQHYYDLIKKNFEMYLESRDDCKLMFIVSHPHGCYKQISIGQWKDKIRMSDGSHRFTYLTCTCPGSTGAAVHLVGYGRHAHSGSLTSGLNYSSD
ncbi:uncharacterized protein LOC106069067 isoform X2 [Biomphalaria glabrata]|nr:uncharacterized protein LOC106069067 isoform X2 [Biomphalaria glabrata]XP_055897459.1 uncharacterized protein LOC106069067 isoform X2 [Biomphalaria glabrata]XP_055897460.1 uncharacterized protein LOC106069067 isoform X2 [Biomphalaria glabrata]XP_055897461.1 uncharacterized protein LOC106069067 isoform X2 [Biomphalaria glabrata]